MNYLVIGDDGYLRQAEVDKIKREFLSPGELELNYSVHEYDDTKGMMDSAGTVPFLADKRVVVVKEAHRLSGESVGSVLSYLKNPPKTSVLVLSSESSFKKIKGYAEISKLVKVIDASTPEAFTIKRWISAFLKKEKTEMSPEALDLLMELKGRSLADIKGELEKIISFSNGEKITVKDIEELVGRSARENIFKLVDAIGSRSAGRTFRIVNDLYEDKKQPHEIIGYLAWHIRLMQKINLSYGQKPDVKALSFELGYSPGYTNFLVDQSRKYPVKKIEKWLSLLLETDKDLKTGKRDGRLALEMLLAELVGGVRS